MAATKSVIYSEHTASRNPPINLDVKDQGLFKHELRKKIPATTLQVLQNADVLIDDIFSRKEGGFYSSYTLICKPSVRQKFRRLLLYVLPYNTVSKGVWIIDSWSAGYFHWLTDALTRLMAVEHMLDDHSILLPLDFKNFSFILQSLDLLNVQVKFYDSKRRLNVSELILPSYTAKTGNYNKELINKVRHKFIGSNGVVAGKRVYTSRKNADKRKVLNEAEVIAVVKNYGFETCVFEEMSFVEQVHLMQQTSILIGIHGAGLTNMLFMPAGGKILELRNRDDAHSNCFFSLASDLSHDYYYLLNQGNTSDTYVVDLSVDINKLKAVIQQMTA